MWSSVLTFGAERVESNLNAALPVSGSDDPLAVPVVAISRIRRGAVREGSLSCEGCRGEDRTSCHIVSPHPGSSACEEGFHLETTEE